MYVCNIKGGHTLARATNNPIVLPIGKAPTLYVRDVGEQGKVLRQEFNMFILATLYLSACANVTHVDNLYPPIFLPPLPSGVSIKRKRMVTVPATTSRCQRQRFSNRSDNKTVSKTVSRIQQLCDSGTTVYTQPFSNPNYYTATPANVMPQRRFETAVSVATVQLPPH